MLALAGIGLFAIVSVTAAEDKTLGYNHDIPKEVLTPDSVETRLGTLRFFDGMSDAETVAKVYDNLDLLRGIETFLNGTPATSTLRRKALSPTEQMLH